MEWWAALLVAGVPAAITSVSLILQQRFNTSAAERADESRRLDAEAERGHQERLLEIANSHAREQAEQDHKRQSREAWKADRRAAHSRLLTRLEELEDAASGVLARVTVDIQLGDDPSKRDFTVPELPKEFVADVALVGSDASAAEAQKAGGAAMMLALTVGTFGVLADARSPEELRDDLDKIRDRLKTLADATKTYRQAAKQDMDTVD